MTRDNAIFFFQAEDGIRDWSVTGVQTCALPIWISAGAGPVAIAAGAGAVWVAAEESGRLVRIEPRSGIATAAVNVGHGPAAVAIGAGAVWVANRPDGTVSRVDPATLTVAGAVKVGGSADALAVGDGGLWVLDEAGRTIVRVDPASGRILRRERVAVSPSGVAVLDGSAWVTATGAATGHRGGTLIVAGQNCGKGCPLDPDFAHSAYWDELTVAYDGLVGYRRVPGTAGETLVPALAEALPEPQDGGRTYAFTLRPGLRYWDGRPVRAGDVSAS